MNELRPTTIPQTLWVCTSIHMADTLKNLSVGNLGSGTVFGSICMSQPSCVAANGKLHYWHSKLLLLSFFPQYLTKLPFNSLSVVKCETFMPINPLQPFRQATTRHHLKWSLPRSLHNHYWTQPFCFYKVLCVVRQSRPGKRSHPILSE